MIVRIFPGTWFWLVDVWIREADVVLLPFRKNPRYFAGISRVNTCHPVIIGARFFSQIWKKFGPYLLGLGDFHGDCYSLLWIVPDPIGKVFRLRLWREGAFFLFHIPNSSLPPAFPYAPKRDQVTQYPWLNYINIISSMTTYLSLSYCVTAVRLKLTKFHKPWHNISAGWPVFGDGPDCCT